ncbi:M1 family metallopeptidase [Streptomyces albireticuli]|uniref:Aminopeptidase N n=1 Tax=Streptomyces albireticuli TaxID=1940 RepID=A0A2A2D0R0_9ACTN|nr:M1 family metallopeptidase [Streptomyces albireticuli]MCD9141967.1 M1 family metallopeptidase [Streptomyces albireticuli]MCD9163089.1 M1 family metallopeptidase [Streptomyces albireticuli]MCD9190141.1 M1 family metallopeptidase [Streptomyces albireticuli]PAU46048.1 metallopeptidase [Streptomyces albireticuli]
MTDTLRRPSVRHVPAVRRRAPRRTAARTLPAVAALALVASCTVGGGGTAKADAGASGAGDPLFPQLGNGGYDVRHYGLTLAYEPDGNHLDGTAVITARATQELAAFNLDLKGLDVRAVRVDGREARTEREGTELTVTPDRKIAKGRTFETVVTYGGTPEEITDEDDEDDEDAKDGEGAEGWVETDDGAVGLGQPTGSMAWFPGNHHPSDKAAYDIQVTVPAGYTAVANGELKREETKGGRKSFSWHSAEPMASYLASVAVSPFKVTTTHAGKLPVCLATHPKQAAAEPRLKKLVPEALTWATGLFGPYPFSSAGAVVDHNPTLGYALETQTKPYFGTTPDDLTVVHEIAHQWFGNSVTPRTWRDMWLNEGFAQYAEWLWEEKRGGRSVQRIFDDYYDGKDPLSEGIWAYPPSDPEPETVSDPPVYGRGAMVLHKLRQAVGDEKFFATVRAWTAEHRHGNADTAEFVRFWERKSGKDLDGLFDVWLRGKGRPATR